MNNANVTLSNKTESRLRHTKGLAHLNPTFQYIPLLLRKLLPTILQGVLLSWVITENNKSTVFSIINLIYLKKTLHYFQHVTLLAFCVGHMNLLILLILSSVLMVSQKDTMQETSIDKCPKVVFYVHSPFFLSSLKNCDHLYQLNRVETDLKSMFYKIDYNLFQYKTVYILNNT